MTRVDVSDTALAKLIARAAVDTVGVARLAPTLTHQLKGAALRAARQLTDAPVEQPRPADPGAVDLDRSEGDVLLATVRIVAQGGPPVVDTVTAVHEAVAAALTGAGRGDTVVSVVVIDTEWE